MASSNLVATSTLQFHGDGTKALYITATGPFKYGFGTATPTVLHEYEKAPNASLVVLTGFGKFWYMSENSVTLSVSEEL